MGTAFLHSAALVAICIAGTGCSRAAFYEVPYSSRPAASFGKVDAGLKEATAIRIYPDSERNEMLFEYVDAGSEGSVEIVLEEGREADEVSVAIRTALSRLDNNILDEWSLTKPLPQDKWIRTDRGLPLGRPVIDNHNEQYRRALLDPEYVYYCVYQLKYAIVEDSIRFRILPRLEWRGTDTNESDDYPGDYSLRYFANRVMRRIVEVLGS